MSKKKNRITLRVNDLVLEKLNQAKDIFSLGYNSIINTAIIDYLFKMRVIDLDLINSIYETNKKMSQKDAKLTKNIEVIIE
jgi:hypothetical protein